MNSRFTRAVRFSCRNFGKSALVFMAVLLLFHLILSAVVISRESDGSVIFNGWSFAGGIFLFVLGIVGLRENLRVCVQNGVSRRSAYLAELTALTATAVLVTLFQQALQILPKAADGSLATLDLYQLLYVGDRAATAGDFLAGGLMGLTVLLALGLLGEFLSVLFWRLNKFWTVVVAVSIPVLLNLVPRLFYSLPARLPAWSPVTFLLDSPWHLTALVLLAVLALAALNWLLLRRAHIRPAK